MTPDDVIAAAEDKWKDATDIFTGRRNREYRVVVFTPSGTRCESAPTLPELYKQIKETTS